MSMPIISAPENPIDREQAINDIIESVALIETGLSHVINAEGEKIQKVVNSDDPVAIDDIVRVNDSAEKMINSIMKLEMMLQSKLEKTNEIRTMPTEIFNETIIPYSSTDADLGTELDGTAQVGTTLGFSSYSSNDIELNGNVDYIDFDPNQGTDHFVAFPMPKDGAITDLAAFIDATEISTTQNVIQPHIKVFVSTNGSNRFNALPETLLNLAPPIPIGSTGAHRASASKNGLNVPLKAGDKILVLMYITHDNTTPVNEYFYGSAGASIVIKTG